MMKAMFALEKLLQQVASVSLDSEMLMTAKKPERSSRRTSMHGLRREMDNLCREALGLLPLDWTPAEAVRRYAAELVAAANELATWCEERGKSLADLWPSDAAMLSQGASAEDV